jgi:hypothetical protein
MELIKPLEIAGKIMSLISEAKKYVIIVSPYYKVAYWKKLNTVIEAAKKRNVEFVFFVRKGDGQSIAEVERIGFSPIEIERLHAKIYLNESCAIVSSMNLNVSSDDSSLDIGLITETAIEYANILAFYETYIKSRSDFKILDTLHHSNLNQTADIAAISKSGIADSQKIVDVNYDYEKSRVYHLEALRELIVAEYFCNDINTFNYKSENSKDGLIVINDFPVDEVELKVGSIIDFKFSDSEFYEWFKYSSKETLREQMPTERLYWNRNVINIYGPKGFEYQLDKDGMIEKANHYFEVIKNVSQRIIAKVP